MRQFFSIVASKNKESANEISLEGRILKFLGKTVPAEWLLNAGAPSIYDDDIHKILKKLISVYLDELDYPATYLFKDCNCTFYHEPISLVLENKQIVFLIDYMQIAAYFNKNFSSKVTINENVQKMSIMLQDEPILQLVDALYNESGKNIPKSTLTSFIKLFVIVDHAMEHYQIYKETDTIDNNHRHFGKKLEFLTGLMSNMPNQAADKVIYSKFKKETDTLLNIKRRRGDDDSEDSDDDSDTDDADNSDTEDASPKKKLKAIMEC